MLAFAIHLMCGQNSSSLVDKICQFFVYLPFADPILKTYISAEVVGLGFLH